MQGFPRAGEIKLQKAFASHAAVLPVPEPETALVMAAFLDGTFAMLQGEDGSIVFWEEYKPEGNAGVITSLDVDGTHVAVGTIDGRCGVMSLGEFVRAPFT